MGAQQRELVNRGVREGSLEEVRPSWVFKDEQGFLSLREGERREE